MNPLVAPEQIVRPHRCALSVNVNKVAHLRNTRHLGIPSVTRAATLCLQAGAHGITVHPRPDARHIRADDVRELHALLKKDWPRAEFNIEGNPFHNLMDFVRELRPQQCTFVPDSEGQFTSDHGWDLAKDGERVTPLIAEATGPTQQDVLRQLRELAENDAEVAARMSEWEAAHPSPPRGRAAE